MRRGLAGAALIVGIMACTTPAYSQRWSIGANVGLSMLDKTAGFHLTPVAEYLFNRTVGIGSEFSVNTQYSAPLLWYPYLKVYFTIHGSELRPYANVGPVLTMHISSATCFGLLLGGGVNIPITGRVYLTPDVLFGPVFNVGGGTYAYTWFANYYGMGVYNALFQTYPSVNLFIWTIRGGIRVEI